MTTFIITLITFIELVLLLAGAYGLVTPVLTRFPTGLKIMASILLTLATISYLYYLALVLNVGFSGFLILLGIIDAVYLFRSYPLIKKLFAFRFNQLYNANTLLLCSAVLLSAVYFSLHGTKYGSADAWGIWNTHAKFLSDYKHWKNLFADNLANSHSDYPLMLPSIIGLFWNAMQSASFVVPLLFSFLQVIGIMMLVYYGLSLKNNSLILSRIAILVFAADLGFQQFGVYQYADLLLSIFILMTIILYDNKTFATDKAASLLGFICASSMWVKNEGILFFIIFSAFLLVSQFKKVRYILSYIAGATLPVLVLLSFKLFYSPENDLVASGTHHASVILHDLSDYHRYITIIDFFLKRLVDNFWFVVILLFTGIIYRRNARFSPLFVVIAILLAGYFFIYLTTPYDLKWHLSTSTDRLLYHVYPSFIYLWLVAFHENFEGNSFKLNLKTSQN